MSNQTTVYCRMQNRLGAMDRVMAAFTHRGIIPARLAASHDVQNRAVEMIITFDCADSAMLDKLVKFLQKQVYVLETRTLSHEAENEAALETFHESVSQLIPTATPEAVSVSS